MDRDDEGARWVADTHIHTLHTEVACKGRPKNLHQITGIGTESWMCTKRLHPDAQGWGGLECFAKAVPRWDCLERHAGAVDTSMSNK